MGGLWHCFTHIKPKISPFENSVARGRAGGSHAMHFVHLSEPTAGLLRGAKIRRSDGYGCVTYCTQSHMRIS